jgi:phosphatidylserine/phosphatidylglycerophosphate/cardiolipin synthase-like enzyme
MSARAVRVVALAVAVLALATSRIGATSDRLAPELPRTEPAAAKADRLIVEPDAGMAVIHQLLASPQHSLDLTMYELVDPAAESILAADAARGVRVRVVLDHRLEAQRNRPAYEFLRSRGVEVAWSASRFFATHEKAFVIDDATAVIMSLNLTDRYYATSRDVALVDHDRRDVTAIEAVFEADFAGRATGTPAADDLIWSPGQSYADLVALIDGARTTITLESEELSSPAVVAALIRASRRGVSVTIAMTYDSAAIPAINAVSAAGARVSLLHGESPLYIHAKLFAIDAGGPGQRAFVGSENLSDMSLLRDRELGIVLLHPALVAQVAATIAADVRSGQLWR